MTKDSTEVGKQRLRNQARAAYTLDSAAGLEEGFAGCLGVPQTYRTEETECRKSVQVKSWLGPDNRPGLAVVRPRGLVSKGGQMSMAQVFSI